MKTSRGAWCRISLFSFLLLPWVSLPGAGWAADRDSGSSLNLLLKARLSDDWFVLSRSNLASRDDHGDYFFGFVGASLGYRLNDTWSVRLGYRRVWIRPRAEWLEEDRPFLEGFATGSVKGFRYTNRSRAEWRLFGHRDNDVRLRNETTLEAPWSFSSLGLRPYLEQESFYGLNERRFETHLFGAGLAWRPARGVKIKAGYRLNRFRIGQDWRERNVLVLGVNVYR